MPQQFDLNETHTLLGTTPVLLQTILKALPERLTRYQPMPADWSINEVIGHLIEAERRGFAGRIRLILNEEHHVCIGWDQNQVARDRQDNDKEALDLFNEFATMRQESNLLVSTLLPAQLPRFATHPKVGTVSVQELLCEWVYHDLNHLKQIESNISAWYWQQMGNTQRFYH